jgi:NAD+ synthase (glutamine-hydrolysing)
MNFNGRKFRLGVEICEDLWDENYDIKVTDLLAKRGADIIVNVFCLSVLCWKDV